MIWIRRWNGRVLRWRMTWECLGETQEQARDKENEADDQVNKHEGCERGSTSASNMEGLH